MCTDPGTPNDGVQISTSYEDNQVVTFQCSRPGYVITTPTITCTIVNITTGEVAWVPNIQPECYGKLFFCFF